MNLLELTKLYDFSGKTVVITGGTGVLGGEMACALVGCGANVVVLDRNPNLPEALQQPMDAGPGKYMVVFGDVLARDSLETAVSQIIATFGDVDMLINVAGGNHPQATTNADSTFFDLPDEGLRFVFDLNIIHDFAQSDFWQNDGPERRGCHPQCLFHGRLHAIDTDSSLFSGQSGRE